MRRANIQKEEIARRGNEIYESKIRPVVESAHLGKFLVLDVDTAEYEIDSDEIKAFDRAIARHPHGTLYLIRIGQVAAHQLGGNLAGAGK